MKNQKEKRKQIWRKDVKKKKNKEMRGTWQSLAFPNVEGLEIPPEPGLERLYQEVLGRGKTTIPASFRSPSKQPAALSPEYHPASYDMGLITKGFSGCLSIPKQNSK